MNGSDRLATRQIALLAILVLAQAFFLSASGAQAQQDTKKVAITVRMIKATSSPQREKTIPANLQDLKDDLASFPYSEFQQLANRTIMIPLNKPMSVPLPFGLRLEVTPTSRREGMYSLSIRLFESSKRTLLNMTIRTRPGACTLIGGPKVDRSVLIFAISAK